MTQTDPDIPLDLHDIQGNIIKAYNREDYVTARYVLYEVRDGARGREFLAELLPYVTTAAPWSRDTRTRDQNPKPPVTLNIAFTYEGLEALELPEASLLTFPQEFVSGMVKRREILGDDGKSAPEHWDPVWLEPVHMLLSLNGPGRPNEHVLGEYYDKLVELSGRFAPGVRCLSGHRGPNGTKLDYQPASALYDEDGNITSKEHFGYSDGISNPFFKGTGANPHNVVGGGKVTRERPDSVEGWEPLETGEFLLGYKDEAYEYPEAPVPPLLARNGTYMVFRKLHENVGSFERYLDETSERFDGGKEALAAKFVGRWRNGAPLASHPTEASADALATRWNESYVRLEKAKAGNDEAELAAASKAYAAVRQELVAFDYDDDLAGSRCPVGAHVRRVNPRGGLEFGRTGAFATRGALTNRRRLLRRGLPYGICEDRSRDDGEHGNIIMMLAASIRRQFEFVQQQWINYGNDFKLGNDKDPLLGNHETSEHSVDGRMVIESEPGSGKPPFLCSGIPRFVETRGGGYFFVPSMTALRMISKALIDPT